MWRKPRIINDPVVARVPGGELKSAHWGENRDRRSTALQWVETHTHARAGALRASRCGHVARYPAVFPACEGSSVRAS